MTQPNPQSVSHTPGPWKIGHIRMDGYDHAEIVSDKGSFIATVSIPNDQANARLIAAAPKLLEALKLIEAECANNAATESSKVCRRIAQAAISKAEDRA